jgi:hypothetical protein
MSPAQYPRRKTAIFSTKSPQKNGCFAPQVFEGAQAF